MIGYLILSWALLGLIGLLCIHLKKGMFFKNWEMPEPITFVQSSIAGPIVLLILIFKWDDI